MLYDGRKQAIRNIRIQKGLTQKEVERRGGIAKGTLSKWEREGDGSRYPSDDQIGKILLGLGCTGGEFWQERTRIERQYFVQEAIENNEPVPEYDVSVLKDQIQRLLVLDMEELPEELRSEFNAIRVLSASHVAQYYSIIDRLVALHNKMARYYMDGERRLADAKPDND